MSDNKDISAQSTSPSRAAIKTLAFFDLETTGLPDLEGFKTKITELSIVACSVNHFLDVKKDESPRVLHKITICLNPYKRIDLKATEITGLTNELLEHENKFDKNAMNLLECFIFQLQQPVCLIAHNGDKFDFPLLKKQCDSLEGALPFTLKCCDSLNVFRKYHELIQHRIDLLDNSYSLQQWTEVRENGLMNAEIEELLENFSNKQTNEDGLDEIFDVLVKNELDEIDRLEKENLKIDARQKINETTPNKPTKAANLHPRAIDPPVARKRSNSSRRELFPSTSSPATRQWTKGQFTLREIYRRFYQKYPDSSHDSESDVMSLLKCAIACKDDFLAIVSHSAINFSDIKRF